MLTVIKGCDANKFALNVSWMLYLSLISFVIVAHLGLFDII